MQPIFCPDCHNLILDLPSCPSCGWQRPLAPGDAGMLAWQAELGHRLSKPRCYPVIVDRRLCVPTEDGAVGALDLAAGAVAWEHSLGEGRAAHALASDGRRLFAGCVDTRPIPVAGKALLALDPRTGAPAWEYPTGAHSLSAAAVAGNLVCITTSDGRLHALDAISGERRWVVAHPAWGPAPPAIGAGVVCAGGRGDTLVAYSTDNGAELWRFSSAGWFAGELGLTDSRVYALCWDGSLYALDARSGRLLWKARGEREKGFTSPPVVADGKLFIGSRVYRETEGQRLPAYALLALRADDGAELWRFATAKHIFVPPAAAGDTLLLSADDGAFYALDAASGAERWVARVEGRVVAQPQVDGDMVYIGTRDGTVYAFRWRASPVEPILPPETYLERGEHEQAAVAYALQGQLDPAAAVYAQRLDRPREAALLYERAGQPGQAARLWRALGDLRRARDCYDAAGDTSGLAETLAQLGEPREAARLYEQNGDLEAAAQLYEQSGDRLRAAELYDQIGQYSRARVIWESLGQWERQVEDLIREGQPATAADILDQQGQPERAAELYEAADQLRQSLDLRLRLEHWEHVAALAARLGDDEQAALAHERLGRFQPAAEAYERAAQRAAGAAPIDEERGAALYERAAMLYESLYQERRAAACHDMVRRYRRLPRVVVTGEAHEAFVEYEWNALTLRMENTGYGPARGVTVELIGEFDVAGDLRVAYLLPGRPVAREISMRPHREHYGPKVPLKIAVSYEDDRGQSYDAVQQQPVQVLRQGAERGGVTPTDIRVDSVRQPSGRPDTASLEEINDQQELLATHRQTLAHYLKQQALLGSAYAPPGVMHGLREARENISRIKAVLRGWGIKVEDYPDDDDEPAPVPASADRSSVSTEAAMPDKRALREAITQAFSLDELDMLCADIEQDLAADGVALQVNLELVGGSGKPGKVLNLITYFDRRGYLRYLVSAARRARPGII